MQPPQDRTPAPGNSGAEDQRGLRAEQGLCVPGNGTRPINSYAVVTYIPDPLGAFLDDMRRELVPNCIPHAHVTILPARPLSLPAEEAWRLIQRRAEAFPAFEVETGDIEVFENTFVAYVAVKKGWDELVALHDALSQEPLWFVEPYPYHPHITVAQDFDPALLWEIADKARQLWQRYPHPRSFLVDSLTFVQATADNRWLDLAHCELAAACRR
ncbi:MAG: 2'-5' RNA ligase family protein [Bryobacteraceae bacterium]